ncbi:hypothetical protein EIP86_008066 [Pleurotus ostreatoroseus]|nr:hypothetical protein EIP86_008066 [Pleurotus ostreatoroseus]
MNSKERTKMKRLLVTNSSTFQVWILDDIYADPSFDSDGLLQHTISLPSLEHLQITGELSGAAQLLNPLAFPLDAHIELWTTDSEASTLSSMMPTILRSSSNGGHLPGLSGYESLVCPHTIISESFVEVQRGNYYVRMSVYFWRASIPASLPQVTHSADTMLLPSAPSPTADSLWARCDHRRLSLNTYYFDSDAILQRYTILGTEGLLSLTTDASRINEEMWERIVDPSIFPRLETLTIFGDVVFHETQRFWEALITRLEASEPMPPPNDGALSNPASDCITRVSFSGLPFPRLRTLTLRYLKYCKYDGLEKTLGPLQRCAELGYKFRRLQLLDVFQDGEDLSTCIPGLQDAISKLGVADEVVVSARPPGKSTYRR